MKQAGPAAWHDRPCSWPGVRAPPCWRGTAAVLSAHLLHPGRPQLLPNELHTDRPPALLHCPAAGQPWDRRFHLILNLAVGGSFFPTQYFGDFTTVSAWNAAAAGWTRPRMEIEHFKVWAWPPQQP